ncbi:MAG: 4-diphosphocytidyl-2-C-methyl-D-erythritol kinase, 4-diphosphocytidyl-2-C-methyl-D-erythritol kinase [Candidatus Peregrinibacteria bacterium GW2011_GWF2_38_29]|nr:MAG: 4-diphosphocytidyl-2-C-methyl-D-erythritol kinase, 4-diphosphocytidyl-2-C-methyl-D-erythritol kinase [Candidatus Peregrinibacteria bacterium GW2011_GWF2_38_29]HBB03244.1 4-(cytidine 5'-diphospho)-2-C-methyl-D-erythritol kinase [Candidatus Peregrinibacteria bacterium]
MTNSLKIKSFAKINLALDILGKAGKYHKIQTVYQQISLHDTLIIKEIEKNKIILKSNDKNLSVTPKNLAYQAAEMIKKSCRVKKGVEIFIDKHIPVASGFGGGSGNGATALKGLNELFKLKLSKAKLEKFAEKLGMDAPFFITGGTAMGTHFGEKVRALTPLTGLTLALFVPNKKSPLIAKTKTVYKKINTKLTGKEQKKTKLLLKELKSKKPQKQAILDNLHNDIEIAMDISEIKKTLLQAGASQVVLSGSGPSVVAFFKNKFERKMCLKALDAKFKKAYRVLLATT